MKKTTTAERLKEIMKMKDLKQRDIYEMAKPYSLKYGVKLNRNELSQYVNAKVEPSQKKLSLLADVLGVSETWLMGYDTVEQSENLFKNIKKTQEFIDSMDNEQLAILEESLIVAKPIEKYINIPVLGEIAAGQPIEAIENCEEFIEIPKSWYKSGYEFIALKVKGDSMYPRICNGDISIIRRQSTFNSGDICAVYVNGYNATLKKVIKKSDGSIILQPLNPAYEVRVFTKEEQETLPVSILGVLVQNRSNFK